jgi:hypothetical protein
VPLRQDRPHHAPDLSRGAEDPNSHDESLLIAPESLDRPAVLMAPHHHERRDQPPSSKAS